MPGPSSRRPRRRGSRRSVCLDERARQRRSRPFWFHPLMKVRVADPRRNLGSSTAGYACAADSGDMSIFLQSGIRGALKEKRSVYKMRGAQAARLSLLPSAIRPRVSRSGQVPMPVRRGDRRAGHRLAGRGVVRCARAARREEGAKSCGYCGSDFTIHEQDLETICPSCFARSATPPASATTAASIAPGRSSRATTDRICPPAARPVPQQPPARRRRATVLECGVCAGLWLGRRSFARSRSAPATPRRPPRRPHFDPRWPANAIPQDAGPSTGAVPHAAADDPRQFRAGQRHPADRCRDDGIWFDATELDAVLRWIKLRRERLSDERRQDEEQARAAQLGSRSSPRPRGRPLRRFQEFRPRFRARRPPVRRKVAARTLTVTPSYSLRPTTGGSR